MAKLFLSYSRKDLLRAQHFAAWLEREGHNVWRDDADIEGGASFSSEIEKALNDSDAVLVLWSLHSVQSAWVRDEAEYGRDKGKLIPFSLDSTEIPLGFRQFQSIDLSKWKGKGTPPSSERIRQAIARVSNSPAPEQSHEHRIARPHLLMRPALMAAGVALAIGAIGGYLLWTFAPAEHGIMISVSASPTSSDAAAAADYANVSAADLASYLPTRFEDATVIGPAEVDKRTGVYRIEIAAGRHGAGADVSATLSDKDGEGILWSKSWSVPDASVVDLRGMVSQAVSQAALCLAKARGSSTAVRQPAFGLLIGICTGLFDPNTSEEQLRATAERVVKLAPGSPEAWADVAMARAIYAESLEVRNGIADPDAEKSAREAIAKARELDPHSAFPYLAEWHVVRNDRLRGLALLDKAVQIDPDEPLVYARLSNSLMSVGRMVDAVQAARRGAELDPLWSFTRKNYIEALACAGQFSRAKDEIADAHRKWPVNSEIDSAEFDFQYRYGDPRRAEQLLPRVLDLSDAQLAPYRKIIAARLDPSPANIDEAVEALKSRRSADTANYNEELLALALFGKVDIAYKLLSDPSVQRSIDPAILFRPEFAGERADPRFMSIGARLGLVDYWRKSGRWPDFCTSEKLRYDCKLEAAKYQ